MKLSTMNVATSGRVLSAARTRTAVAFPSTALATALVAACASVDLGSTTTHLVQGAPPPRGSEALL